MVSLNRKQKFQLAVPATLLLFLFVYVLLGGGSPQKSKRHGMHMDFNPLEHCNAPMDSVVGYSSDVPSMSNCHRHWLSETYAYTTIGYPHEVMKKMPYGSEWKRAPTGLCWTADEFVARYLLHTRGIFVYFGGSRHDLYWENLKFFGSSGMHRLYERINFENKVEVRTTKRRKRHTPLVGDVVVWNSDYKAYFPRGHVAVVVKVEDDVSAAGGEAALRELKKERRQPSLVYIAEQNFDNKNWEGRNFSRVLKFTWMRGDRASLEDPDGPPLMGHVRVGKLLEDASFFGDL
ncbi:hypothetical protein, conserved [Trypanosoma brucei gambiense DAL972]|uniref:Peptidase C51 domain-containing protein n=1 Tax=Trypanosoma brucei gambiense (strain MHOM/CI/86/DAL972) TaxID=679716 RepID=C9ZK72_TRYB9|nr:hypothetical protein, conserved [Trypanosoma brucei gambiense DAL972]CBH09836.1 hypothetical protein, conserved [Trypanosoma brucei gambiense DAL972]|eukprot:XP_011772129.1 hypothetical protein, conserved [Trypanosoma brucei gambiense DAL972]